MIPDHIEPLKGNDRKRHLLQPKTANELVAVLNPLRKMEIDGYRATWSDNNLIFTKSKTTDGDTANASTVGAEFIIDSVSDDHLACFTYHRDDDGAETIGATSFNVAKPWMLRKTPFHGQTINGLTYTFLAGGRRTVTGGEFGLTQEVVPNYAADQIIHAIRLPELTIDSATDALDCQWLEVSPGRVWLDVHQEFELCLRVNGVETLKKVNIRSSNLEDV